MIVPHSKGEETSVPCNTGDDTLDVQLKQSTEVQRGICIGHRPASLFAMVHAHLVHIDDQIPAMTAGLLC